MKQGGLADSPFFRLPQVAVPTEAQAVAVDDRQGSEGLHPKPSEVVKQRTGERRPKKRDTTIPRHRDTKHDTTVSRYHDTMIETVRKAVREFGKEAATHRFTVAEKQAIADIIYRYKQRSIKTSENEVARIAINFLVVDYQENGEASILHRVLQVLNT
jgi:hypothetical protein